MTIWVTAALKGELLLLLDDLNASFQGRAAGLPHYAGKAGSHTVRLGIVGIGVTSAALALGTYFSLERPELAVMVGSAGSLPDSGLPVGGLVAADTEILAELGAAREAGIGHAASLRLPDTPQELDFDASVSARLADAAASVSPVCRGRLLTVVGVSARPEQALSRARHFGALAENMEGYALALAGRRFGVPAAELRGISNRAGDRDRTHWDFKTANERAQKAVLNMLRRL